jgi:hypothetical protein
VEHWKVRERDLSIKWGVRGVGVLKSNRNQYIGNKVVKDPITGEVTKVYPMRHHLLRQVLQLPFAIATTLALGTLIAMIFTAEIIISEVYHGPFRASLVRNQNPSHTDSIFFLHFLTSPSVLPPDYSLLVVSAECYFGSHQICDLVNQL